MFEELLQILQAGGSFEIGALAKKLNASPELVKMMIEHMKRTGLIECLQPVQAGCSACPSGGSCGMIKKRTGCCL